MNNIAQLSSISNIDELLEKVPEKTIERTSAGNMVKITMSSRLKVKDIDIDEELLSKENKYLLEEMIASTYNDVIGSVLKLFAKTMKEDVARTNNEARENISPDMIKNMVGRISVKDPDGKEIKMDVENPQSMKAFSDILAQMTGGGDDDKTDDDDDATFNDDDTTESERV